MQSMRSMRVKTTGYCAAGKCVNAASSFFACLFKGVQQKGISRLMRRCCFVHFQKEQHSFALLTIAQGIFQSIQGYLKGNNIYICIFFYFIKTKHKEKMQYILKMTETQKFLIVGHSLMQHNTKKLQMPCDTIQ